MLIAITSFLYLSGGGSIVNYSIGRRSRTRKNRTSQIIGSEESDIIGIGETKGAET